MKDKTTRRGAALAKEAIEAEADSLLLPDTEATKPVGTPGYKGLRSNRIADGAIRSEHFANGPVSAHKIDGGLLIMEDGPMTVTLPVIEGGECPTVKHTGRGDGPVTLKCAPGDVFEDGAKPVVLGPHEAVSYIGVPPVYEEGTSIVIKPGMWRRV